MNISPLLLITLVFSGHQIIAKDNAQVKALDPMLTHYEYPFPVSFFQFESQNQSLKMAYLDVSPTKPNGKTVLLFHGKNFNGAYWKTTIEALTSDGFRVIAPDQIGFGKSSKPANYQFSFHQLANNTAQLLDHLKVNQVAVMGHSMGGMLASRFALNYPKMTQQLVLLNPIGLEDYAKFAPYKPVEWWYANELKKNYDKIRSYQQASYYDGQWKPEYDPWVYLLAGWTRHPQYEKVAWNAALTYDMIYTQPVVHELNRISCPTLLIIGTRDRTALGKPLVSDAVRAEMGRYDRLGKQTKAKMKNATLVELENIGHLPHIEAFDRYIQPLESFLAE